MIYKGFVAAFKDNTQNRPMISRGNSPQQTRFYFADAAADLRVRQVTAGLDSKAIFGIPNGIASRLDRALRAIIVAYIQSHAGALRQEGDAPE